MSKNMYTNRNTHDTNCHRNYGGPNKDAVTTGTFEQADRTMILTMIIWENLLLPMTRLV